MVNLVGAAPLRTNRLLLRKIAISDAESLIESGSLTGTCENAINTITEMMKYNDDPCSFNWVIDFQGKAIGRIKVCEISSRDNYMQIAYDIGERYRCQGFMTEAVKAVINYLLKDVAVHRIYCQVRVTNIASARV